MSKTPEQIAAEAADACGGEVDKRDLNQRHIDGDLPRDPFKGSHLRVVTDTYSGRVPPHNLDAEAAVLSASMLSRDSLDVVLAELAAEHWYSDAHRLIFEAMAHLRSAGTAVDIVTVAAHLRETERIAQVGGARYLAQLVDATPAVAHIEDHCAIVRQLAQRRQLIATCQAIAAEGYGDVGEHEDFVATSEQRIFSVTKVASKHAPELIGPLAEAEHQACVNPPEVDESKVLTRLRDYDEKIGGLWRGDLIIVAGRPGMGKSSIATWWARNIASQVAEDDYTDEVAIFSLEMPRRQLGQRMLAQESSVSLSKIRDRGRTVPFQPSEMKYLDDARAYLRDLPMHVYDKPGILATEIVSQLRRLHSACSKRGRRIGLAVVDYLQKVRWAGKVRSRDEMVGEICAALKDCAMDLDIPVALLSQLNRSLEKRDDKRPLLSDCRESGNIEQDADQVVFVYRESYYKRQASKREAELIVAKNRMGKTGVVEVGWWPWCTRFVDLTDAQESEASDG